MKSLRILITGMSRMQAGLGNPLLDAAWSFSRLLGHALHDLGHVVQRRPVVVGERLDTFDVVMVGISPTGTTGALLYSAWDAISRARAEGAALAFFIDDHKLTQIRDTIKSDVATPTERPIVVNGVETMVTGARMVKDHFGTRRDRDWAVEHLPELVQVGEALLDRPWPTTIIPAHAWGNHTLITEALRFDVPRPVFVDPSAYTWEIPSTPVPWEERKHAWVSANLPDKKLSEFPVSRHRVGWAVHEFGDRRAGQVRITEPEVQQEYQRCIGMVANRRIRHDGSGWWRVRYLHAAQAKSLVLASTADTAAMGGPFHLPVETIESMAEAELHALAHAQSDAYFAQQWTRDEFSSYLDTVVRWVEEHERA